MSGLKDSKNIKLFFFFYTIFFFGHSANHVIFNELPLLGALSDSHCSSCWNVWKTTGGVFGDGLETVFLLYIT